MMRFLARLILAGALAVAATPLVSPAAAQSLPNVSGIKQTTNRAVAKTNAKTLAMTSVDSAKIATPPAATAPAPKRVERPADTTRAHGVRATAAAGSCARVMRPSCHAAEPAGGASKVSGIGRRTGQRSRAMRLAMESVSAGVLSGR